MPNEAPGQAPPGAPGEESSAPGKTKDVSSDAMFEQSGASTTMPLKGPIGSAPEQGALEPEAMPKPKTGQTFLSSNLITWVWYIKRGKEAEEEVVSVRPIYGVEDESQREVRISCPDATGLGCDFARLLLDFGLRILDGDVSTDGRWCFMIFKVQLSIGVPAHWALLKRRLEAVCPSAAGEHQLWRWSSLPRDFQHPFLLQVASYDRRGFLHDLMHTLWEADVAVFKAHITTGPGGKVLDMFWIYDNRCELPENHRVLQITELVRECLQQRDANCSITPAPPESCSDDSAAALLQRCACKDATPASPLRKIVTAKSRRRLDMAAAAAPANEVTSESEADEFARLEDVKVTVDNCTTSSYTVVGVVCRDRKGLVYDLFRTLKDIHIRVAYAKVCVRGDMAEADLFVEEADGQRAERRRRRSAAPAASPGTTGMGSASSSPYSGLAGADSGYSAGLESEDQRIVDRQLEAELVERVRAAVLLPVRIAIKDVYDDTCTELLITASLDSGGRGRPRVTYDVTAALNTLGLCVFMADVYVEALAGDAERRPQELHRFLVHCPDGRRLESVAEKRSMYDSVRAALTGTKLAALRVPSPRALPRPPPPHSLLHSLATWKWSA
ncbi:hypothetical protein WJX81_006685 [Elliptochloris bilobata]|uniref:ACT domain-containing protein n=1 Tax=Elliptochloris bilobata TaxID=381761 RepID=A0AAW1REJ1_9CHLO